MTQMIAFQIEAQQSVLNNICKRYQVESEKHLKNFEVKQKHFNLSGDLANKEMKNNNYLKGLPPNLRNVPFRKTKKPLRCGYKSNTHTKWMKLMDLNLINVWRIYSNYAHEALIKTQTFSNC